jgi:hypothetical protein
LFYRTLLAEKRERENEKVGGCEDVDNARTFQREEKKLIEIEAATRG